VIEPQLQDGRRRRAAENREKTARAMFDLIRETGEVPTAKEVADRAKLSRRTVFRLFDDLEDVQRAAMEMQRAEVMARFPAPTGGGSLDGKIDALVQHRSALYEYIMPLRRVAERLKHRNRLVRESQATNRKLARAHLEGLFAADLPSGAEREAVVDALLVATAWSAWAHLRDDHGLDRERSKAAMRTAVAALLNAG
jgi:TetR/AcrR family transcriptional regulator of autoinduction and epiphytic fitness